MKTQIRQAFLIISGTFLILTSSFGQEKEKKHHGEHGHGRQEKVEELRKQFYKEKLGLNPDEESKFWPLFDEHQKNMQALKKEIKSKKEITQNAHNDVELRKNIQDLSDLKTKMIRQESSFETNCIPVIGFQKTGILIGLDEQFKKEMMKQVREKRKEKKEERNEPKK